MNMRLLAGSLLATLALASSVRADPHARQFLITDTDAIVVGKPFTVAILFTIDPDWHLYYRDPGDSGMPPSIEWKLPAGLNAGPLQFPKPEILKTLAGTNFIYRDEVALLVTITPDASFKFEGNIQFSATLKWLECNDDQCLPGKGVSTVVLPVRSAATMEEVERFKVWKAKVQAGESFNPVLEK